MSDAYESMFGREQETEAENLMPNVLPLKLNKPLIKGVMDRAAKEKRWVLAFVIGTKPCFYKFYGSIMAAEKAGLPYLVINSNQHYDDVLTHGLKEFDFSDRIASNLSIRGDLAQKSAELMIKISWLARYLKRGWKDVTVIPVVLGDTILTSIVPAAWMFSRREKAIQNEAGLRSMAPKAMRECEKLPVEDFIQRQFEGEWELIRNEPFPEQWDTYTSAAGSQYHFCPVDLNRQHLIREGYPEENIWKTGGVVVDALDVKRRTKSERSIFDIYPQLEKGDWIRMDIHRRENLTPRRFKAIMGGLKTLVEKGHNVNFIEMSATRMAIDWYGYKDQVEKLKKNKNFLYTSIWPEYGHVIEFFESRNCLAALTDSGGVQEELNLLKKPCLTCRLTTDRPETVFDAKSNILVPPVSPEIISRMVSHVTRDDALRKEMSSSKGLYGAEVGKRFIHIIKGLMEKDDNPFKWAHDALGLWRDDEKGIDYF